MIAYYIYHIIAPIIPIKFHESVTVIYMTDKYYFSVPTKEDKHTLDKQYVFASHSPLNLFVLWGAPAVGIVFLTFFDIMFVILRLRVENT